MSYNPHHLLIVFNKPIKAGPSPKPGYNICAGGSDIDSHLILARGTRFIKLEEKHFSVKCASAKQVYLINKSGKICEIAQEDVVFIKEWETDKVLWINPNACPIIIELDMSSRPQCIVRGAPKAIWLDRFNFVYQSWTEGWDSVNFPGFIKLKIGAAFRDLDDQSIEFENMDEKCVLEKHYILQVYEKGGKTLWQKQIKPAP